MYNMATDKYACDFCGFELKWDETDETHGDMWGCEVCGREFCKKCFTDRHGDENFSMMVRGALSGPFEDDLLRCPDCFSKEARREHMA